MARVELRGVKKSYGSVDVIKGIDLVINHGEFCVFVGPSGCGKSTLLRMISGLEELTDGDILIDDKIVNQVAAADRGLAMVFQSYALYPHMSVRQNLSFGLENIGTPKAEISQKVAEIAKMLQIEALLARRPKDLSGGQRQRVAIGRAVVREPQVFLFDEPLSNLDAELRIDMRGEISSLHRRLGNTMIYVTHDQIEAMTMADKIAVLRAGNLEQFGAPLDLYNHPANIFVAGFIGSPKMNFFSGNIIIQDGPKLQIGEDTHIPLPDSGFSFSPKQKVTLGIRPNHIAIEAEGSLTMLCRKVEQLGSESYLYGTLKDGSAVTIHKTGQTIPLDEKIHLSILPHHIHLFDTMSGLSLIKDGNKAAAGQYEYKAD